MRSICVAVLLASSATASADDFGVTRKLAEDSAFSPGFLRAHDDGGTAYAIATTTLDGASDRVKLDALGEVRVYGRFRLLVRVQDAFGDVAKPGIGAGVQLLDEARHGVASTAYLQYKTEGFTEPEGELEAVIALSKRLGPVRTSLDVAYGQDLEGNERDAELAIGGQIELRRGLFAGVTGRYRDGLGTTKEPIARDGIGGGTATITFGRFAISALAGVAMVETRGTARQYGPAATLALGTAF
jgi:hypothetical protein